MPLIVCLSEDKNVLSNEIYIIFWMVREMVHVRATAVFLGMYFILPLTLLSPYVILILLRPDENFLFCEIISDQEI